MPFVLYKDKEKKRCNHDNKGYCKHQNLCIYYHSEKNVTNSSGMENVKLEQVVNTDILETAGIG